MIYGRTFYSRPNPRVARADEVTYGIGMVYLHL